MTVSLSCLAMRVAAVLKKCSASTAEWLGAEGMRCAHDGICIHEHTCSLTTKPGSSPAGESSLTYLSVLSWPAHIGF